MYSLILFSTGTEYPADAKRRLGKSSQLPKPSSHAANARLKEISVLQRHIGTYKTKDIYAQYRKAGYSKKFLSGHEAEIAAYKAAKAYFNEQKHEKLPTIKMLQ